MPRLTTKSFWYTLLALQAFLVLIRPIDDRDIWWHLRTGQYIFRTFSIPRTDIYSYTAFGKPWIAHEWLSEFLMYGIFKFSGWIGLILVSSLITAAVLLYVARQATAPPLTIALVVVGVQSAALIVLRSPRPRLATFLFSAIFLVELRNYVGNRKSRLFLLPIVTICWVNLHAGYPLGILLIVIAGTALIFEGRWGKVGHLALILALCMVAISINPQGIRMYAYPFETQFSPAQMSFISEWNAPDFRSAKMVPFLFLILAIITVLGLSRKRMNWFDTLCLTVACFMSLRSQRHLSVLALVAIPIVAEHSWNWISWTKFAHKRIIDDNGSERLVPFALILLVLSMAHLPGLLKTLRGPVKLAEEPTLAVKFLNEQSLPNNVFSNYEWNDYLIWAAPSRKVFIDGRADMYGDEFLTKFGRLYFTGENWEATFKDYGVNTVLLPRSSSLAALISRSQGWSEVYRDDLATIFARK